MTNHNLERAPKNLTRGALVALVIILGIYLVVDHGEHLTPYLPFTFLLGCLFMHLFMHGGHGGHGKQETHKGEHPHA